MIGHMTLGTFIVLVVAGITYGIIMAVWDLFPHATHVVPKGRNASLTNGTTTDQPPFLLHGTNETSGWNTYFYNHSFGASAFPRPRYDVPPQCIDPTFACQDLQSARLCRTVSPCIHDVWATMSAPPSDNDEVCDICKEMVKEARDQLLSNMTQEEIKEVFEGSCKLLPIKLIADGCIKVVDEIIPQLVEMLASRMDPTMVCTVSGMCFASENPVRHILKMLLVHHGDDECQECQTMMTDVKTFLKTTPESDVKKYVENFCDEKMPSYLCTMLVDSYLPSLYTYIVDTDSKTLCNSVGICPKTCKPKDVTKFNDELTCEFCEHLLQHVIDLITANTTAEEFRTALLNFCNHTGSFSEKCTAVVNDYYDMLFNYIRKLDTKGMCTLMGLCNNEKCSKMPLIKLIPARETLKRVPLLKLKPASVISKDMYHPLIRLIPANVASKKDIETNDIFPSQLPLEKFIHPLALFQKDTECAFCRAISFFLEKELKEDRSKDGVRSALENVCKHWVVDFPAECQQFLDNYSVKIQQAVAKDVKLEDVCGYSKICELENGKSELGVRVIPKGKEGPFCDLCKNTMTEVENTLSDPATKQKLEDLVDQSCRIIPKSLRDGCVNFLNSNVDALLDILQQELQPDNICPALRLCDGKSRIQVSQRVKDLECDVCKQVFSSLREKLANPDSKEVVLTFLEEGCAKLPGSLAGECKTFVDENIDTVIGMMVQQLDPDTVCSILKICKGSVKVARPKKVNDIECDLCKEVIGKIEDLVKDNKTEAKIQNALDNVCSYLPTSLSAKCKSFVDMYTKTIITLIMEEMDPDMICAELNLCPGSVKEVKPKKVKDLECDLCKEVVGKVEALVKDKKTEDEIQSALEEVCSILPDKMKAKCITFVDNYTKTIITLIMEEMDPDMICAELNLCPANSRYPEWQSKAQDLECQGCQYGLHFLQNQLTNPETQEEIKNLLKKVCDVLPNSLAKNCEAFVEEYGSALLVLISQEIDPSIVCFELKMCSNQPKIFEKAVDILHPFKSDECSVCVTVVDYLDKLLEEDDVDKEITKLVEKVCTILPASYNDSCVTILETYGPYILQMIGQVADSKQVCQEIDLCSRPAGHVHLLGGNKCTFGPSYWCKSAAHASACKAEMFCKEKFWDN